MIDAKDLAPIFDGILEVLEAAQAENEAAQVKIADLSKKVVESDRLILEKVATAKKEARTELFPVQSINETIDHLIGLRLVRAQDKIKIATALAENPVHALTLLEKISENLSPLSEGMGVPKSTDPAESDPDGWDDFRAGRPVRLKQ